MAAEKKYHVGKRMIIFRNIFYVAATFVLIVFYFIYDYVFADQITWLKGAPFSAIFIFLEVLMIYLAKKYVDRVIVINKGRIEFDGIPRDIFSRIEELEEMGLSAPAISYIMRDLKDAGFNVGDGALTVKEAADKILDNFRRGHV